MKDDCKKQCRCKRGPRGPPGLRGPPGASTGTSVKWELFTIPGSTTFVVPENVNKLWFTLQGGGGGGGSAWGRSGPGIGQRQAAGGGGGGSGKIIGSYGVDVSA